MTHPAFSSDSVATITGGASGIGLAIATEYAAIGMPVAVLDAAEARLPKAEAALRAAGAPDVLTVALDVSDPDQLAAAEAQIAERFGGTDILMNNAGIGRSSSCLETSPDWQAILGVNLMGPIQGTHVFAPRMLARGRPGMIVNTGSKQGITTPPGNPAYNTSKAGLKAFTEALAHELRNTDGCALTAHLLIPGFVDTPLTGSEARDAKPAAAWTPAQTAKFFIDSVNRGDFYILCPDNDVPRALDEKRMAWAIGDVIENRPALSRWHPEWAARFESFIQSD
jgi:NAD(P)-dependent dehydrogenase (short-subunit alcohol dehydrogenase family)